MAAPLQGVRVDVDLVLRACDVRPVAAAAAPRAPPEEDVAAFGLYGDGRRGAERPWPRATCDRFVCPRIFGRRTLKLAVLLTAVGGVGSDERDQDEEEHVTRTGRHAPLAVGGRPGHGQVAILRFMAKLAPR